MSGEPTLELCLSRTVHATGSGAIDVGNPVGYAVGHCPAVGEIGANDWSLDDFQNHVVVVEDDLSDFVPDFVTALKRYLFGVLKGWVFKSCHALVVCDWAVIHFVSFRVCLTDLTLSH